MSKGLISIGGLLAAAVLFVAFNILAGAGLRSARVDLTENHLYTLSPGSRNIAAKLQDPLKLTLYFSEKQATDAGAAFKTYGSRVKEVLEGYARASHGKITVETVNPEPFSEAEDRAVQAGLVGIPTGRSGDSRFYFGLVGADSTNRQEVIPLFRPNREEFLEYELTRMIYLLSGPTKKVVGLMSWLPIEGGADNNPMMQRQGRSPPWQIVEQLKEVFDVKTIPTTAQSIPPDVKVLMVVHPKAVPDKTLYAIDQFVLRGGRAVIFVDPMCEADVPPGVNPMQAMQIPKNSDLKKLFDAWGLEMLDGKFAGDRDAAIRVSVGGQGRPEAVQYIAWLGLGPKNLNHDDPIVGDLQQMNLATSGVLKKKDGATTDFLPLITTGTDSMVMPTQKIQFMPDPKALMAEFKPGGENLTLAARISGKFKSAFTGPPADNPPDAAPKPDAPKDQPPAGPHIAESTEPANVVVVADCDMLTDQFWVRQERLGQILLGTSKIADNGEFVIGALDNLSGSSDLISVRARGRFSRPFDRVNQIRKNAEQAFLSKEQDLQRRLRETENKINELQRQRPDAAGGGAALLLTPEQQAEIDMFRKQKVETRKELRDVQHQLRKDIESLGTELKFINVGLMPVVVGAFAVGLGLWRAARRKSDRSAEARSRAPAAPIGA